MYRNNSSRIFTTVLVIVVIVAVVIGIVTLTKYMFGGGTDQQKQQASKQDQVRANLLNTAANRSVRVTARGPIVADERFVTQRVIMSPTKRAAYVYRGYLESEKRKIELANTTKGYEEFVYALDKAGFTKEGKQLQPDQQDIRGICAKGRVYEYEVLEAQKVVYRAWTSTCGGSTGSFGAEYATINNLFTSQIPDGAFVFANYEDDK